MAGYKIISYDRVSSTQQIAHDLISSGRATDKTVVVANSQTAGRGRYSHRWKSPRGNLYASFIFESNNCDPRMSYAVAVAAAETIAAFGAPAQIKWPNDILIDGRKICGILIEFVGNFVIVGIGINVASAPNVETYATECLASFGAPDKGVVLRRLMQNLDSIRGCDFDVVRARWMELAAGIRRPVTWRGRKMELVGIDARGALILYDGTEKCAVFGDEISLV